MKFHKLFYIIIGCLSMISGAVGAIIPVLPTFPFLMLATFCFAKSSQRLHTWFTNTKLYKDNLSDYVEGKGMTLAAKKRIMLSVTLLMALGFTVMLLKSLYLPCLILSAVWVFHIVYFLFGIKTIPPV